MKIVIAGLAASLLLCSLPAQAAGLKKGYAVCRSQASLTQLLEASMKNDAARFSRLMREVCQPVRGNEKIRILKKAGTMAHISLNGRRGTWWTVVEALR